jgi:hypothetical protein
MKFDMEQKKLFRRLHLLISSTYKISFSVFKRGGIVQLRPTLPISFLTRDQNNLGKFNNLISQFDWYKLLSNCTQNINMMCVRFTEKYLEFARECIPTKTIIIRDRDKRGLILVIKEK